MYYVLCTYVCMNYVLYVYVRNMYVMCFVRTYALWMLCVCVRACVFIYAVSYTTTSYFVPLPQQV
jgi:hypothetical protein